MLKAISLHTLKQIFETEALAPLSPMARMSYISCLMYYFEDMSMDLDSAQSFNIIKAQVKAYDKTLRYFEEMQTAGLVQINDQTITFINHWNRHIDKNLLTKPDPEHHFNGSEPKSATEHLNDLLENKSLFDLIKMHHKLSDEQIKGLIYEFAKEGEVTKTKYYNPARCAEHCFRWINKKAPKMSKVNPGTGKILGR